MEQRYQAVLAVIADGRGVGEVAVHPAGQAFRVSKCRLMGSTQLVLGLLRAWIPSFMQSSPAVSGIGGRELGQCVRTLRGQAVAAPGGLNVSRGEGVGVFEMLLERNNAVMGYVKTNIGK